MLAGRAVVVTGGSSGIGRAIAEACAAAGADVLLTYRANRAGAEQAVDAIRRRHRRAEAVACDIARDADVAALAEAARAFGPIHGWVNNAGADILTGAARTMTRRAKLDLVLDVDLRGTILASWAALDVLADGGAIVNMSWDHVHHGMPGENPILYAAAKGGVEAFTRSLAREAAPRVRVNAIAPGFIHTAFGDEASDDWKRFVVSVTPLERWGLPADVAGAATWLLSDAAAFVSGQVIRVNGGTRST